MTAGDLLHIKMNTEIKKSRAEAICTGFFYNIC